MILGYENFTVQSVNPGALFALFFAAEHLLGTSDEARTK